MLQASLWLCLAAQQVTLVFPLKWPCRYDSLWRWSASQLNQALEFACPRPAEHFKGVRREVYKDLQGFFQAAVNMRQMSFLFRPFGRFERAVEDLEHLPPLEAGGEVFRRPFSTADSSARRHGPAQPQRRGAAARPASRWAPPGREFAAVCSRPASSRALVLNSRELAQSSAPEGLKSLEGCSCSI